MAKTILVTGFEPFGGRGENPSLQVLARLKAPAGARLLKARLPVSGRAVGPRLAALIARHKPDLVVSLGLAAGPAAYFVTTDPLKLAAAARRAGAPAYVSNHAGGYVCNTLMYRALAELNAAGCGARYAFIHIPVSTEMALKEKPGKNISPSLPLNLLVKAVGAAIKEAAR